MAIFPSMTLKSVNRVRVARGAPPLKKLRKGDRRNQHICAIANSLSDVAPGIKVHKRRISGVDQEFAELIAREFGTHLDPSKETPQVVMPLHMQGFVFAYDRGAYDELART